LVATHADVPEGGRAGCSYELEWLERPGEPGHRLGGPFAAQAWPAGVPYAVVKKYGDDAGGREAALITYYGFLSIFPLLLGVAVLSLVLASHPDLRERLIAAVVPQVLRSTVEHSLATLPTSTIPLLAGLIGLLFSGTGVVFSVYQTLNHVAAVPHRFRAGFVSRYVRVLVMLVTLLLGGWRSVRSPWWPPRCPASPGCNERRRRLGQRWSSSQCCCLPPGCC